MIYLDNAATTMPKAPGVAEAMSAATCLGNAGRGSHSVSMGAADVIYSVRCSASKLFNAAEPENVIFALNATHGINIAVHDMCLQGRRIIVSPYEHNAVMRALKLNRAVVTIAKCRPYDNDTLLESFKRALAAGADGVVCTHVSNVFGVRLPVEEIAELCRKYRVPMLIDASQSAGTVKIDAEKLGVKYIAMPGHKGLYGPQGTGLLICDEKVMPLIAGGTGSNSKSLTMPGFLPDRLEAGTQNLPGIAGLGCGIKFVANTGTDAILSHERVLMSLAAEKLRLIDGIKVFWPDDRLPDSGVLSFSCNQIPSSVIGEKLSDCEIAVRAGFHCAPIAHMTMGTYDTGTVRISASYFTNDDDINALDQSMRDIMKRV